MTAEIQDITEYGYSLPLQMSKVSTWGWFSGDSPPGSSPTPGGEYISDHVPRAIALFIEQFEDKPVLEANERSFLSPVQPLEDLLQDMKRDMLNLTGGTGDRLDIIGEILNLPRDGRPDSDYRNALIAKIGILSSNGEPESVRNAAIFFTGASSVKLDEVYPAGLSLLINTIFPIPTLLLPLMENVASAGVRLELNLTDGEVDFDFDGEGGYPPAANTLGFGETGAGLETEGGRFIELI